MTAAALAACRCVTDDFEIIIVDDGSTDRTGELAEEMAARYPEVRVVHNEVNLGYGAALQRGFRAARKKWVFYTDGDGQFDLHEIHRLVPLLDRYDIVSAYRINRQDRILRRFNGWGWTKLTGLLLGIQIRDIDCAFKLYPRTLFDEIELHSRGALIDAEILAKAQRLGYRIGQVGVHHYARRTGEQTGGNLTVILRAFVELVHLRIRMRPGAGRKGPGQPTHASRHTRPGASNTHSGDPYL